MAMAAGSPILELYLLQDFWTFTMWHCTQCPVTDQGVVVLLLDGIDLELAVVPLLPDLRRLSQCKSSRVADITFSALQGRDLDT